MRAWGFQKGGAALLSISLFLISTSVATAADAIYSFVPQTVLIPRSSIEAPATDLLLPNGETIDRDALVDRIKRGEDISLLEPATTDVWDPAEAPRKLAYPEPAADGAIHLQFDSILESPSGLMRSRVATDDESNEPYRLVMSWNLHPALMNARLLQLLGFTLDPPKHYRRGVIRFADVAFRNLFLDEIARGTRSDPERWLVKKPNDDELTIELRDFVLEPARISTPAYYWGALSRSALQGRRSLRALLIPLVLTHVPESINLWGWEVGKILSDSVALYHPFAGSFDETTFDDARWVARKLSALSEADWNSVVAAGGYPKEIEPLLLEKLKARRNHLIEMFKVVAKKFPVRSELTIKNANGSGYLIKNGKLLQKSFDGYGFDFIGDDPESPLRKDELFRFFKLEGIGAALTAGLDQLNDRVLNLRDSSDLAARRSGGWTLADGLVGGFRAKAGRKVVSGVYYGSESEVQLVDQVSLSASLGYFMGAKPHVPHPNVFSLKPNVAVTRTYLHVKPIASMQEALKTPWKELAVIPKMRALGALLDLKSDATSSEDETQKKLSAFLDEFKAGENFTIIDSLDLGLDAHAKIPVGAAFGSVGLSASFDQVILRRTMFQRLADGKLQISLQRVRKRDLEAGVSFNFLIELISLQASPNWKQADAQVYVIDPSIFTLAQAPELKGEAKKLSDALLPLLRRHDSSILEKSYSPFTLDHRLKGMEVSFKLLPWSWLRYHEEHKLSALPQQDHLDAGAKREDYERNLISLRDVRLRGANYLDAATDGVNAGVNRLLGDASIDISPDAGGKNPSSSFLGNSHWFEVRTEAETTASRDSRSLIQLQENFQGWTMSKKKLMSILDKSEQRMKEVLNRSTLIRREEFQSTEKLLLYQISATLILTDKGLDPVRAAAKEASNRTEDDAVSAFTAKLVADARVSEKKGWIKGLYKKLIRIPEKTADPKTGEEHARGLHELAQFIYGKLTLGEIVRLVGEKNSFFQIRVSGFRAKDENGDSEYLSDSVGVFDSEVGAGAFKEFAAETGISIYEASGQYLGDGI